MATITDLSAASSVASGDNMVINQSGTDKRVTISTLFTGVAAVTGSWTPTIAGSSGAPLYSVRTGSYIKIGPLVMAAFDITLADKSTLAGNLTLTGLPFTTANIASYFPAVAVLIDYVSYTAGLSTYAVPIANDTRCYLVKANGAGVNASLAVTDIGHATTIRGTIVYRASS